jgi:hypothetical protein
MKSTRRGRELLPKWIIGWVLVILSLFAYNPNAKAAVTGKITGLVVDANTGEPLPGVNVLIEGTNMGAATDEDGYFVILRVPPDIYNVQARMIGYESVTQTGVEVITEHTTQLRFRLKATVIEGTGITVRAEADIIKMDLSSSAISAKSEAIEAVPFVNEIGDYINKQAGVQDWMVRGGSLDQVGFMKDGLNLVDGRTNSPALMPPLSAIKEVSVIQGGFAPEYGNVRSGLINIVTREPSNVYRGSLIFRYSPAHLKHEGPSVYDSNHYWVGAFALTDAPELRIVKTKYDTILKRDIIITDTIVDYLDSLCWIGSRGLTRKARAAYSIHTHEDSIRGDYYTKLKEIYFAFDNGWLLEARNDRDSAAKLREKYIWLHRIQGADKMVDSMNKLALVDTTFRAYDGPSRVGTYGDIPDYSVDAGFGGPLPVIGGYLGDLGFYAAYKLNKEAFGLPSSRDYYTEQLGTLKLISHLSQSIKLSLDIMYGEQNTLSACSNGEFGGEQTPEFLDLSRGVLGAQIVDFVQGTGYMSGAGGVYLTGANDAFRSLLVTTNANYYPAYIPPYNVYHNMQGFTFDHALSDKTFYTVRISHLGNRRECNAYYSFEPRDDTTLYKLPSGIKVDETPYGYYLEASLFVPPQNTTLGNLCAGAVDSSKSHTWNFKADLTTQINPFNEIKLGVEYDYSDLYTHYEKNRWESPHENWINEWEANPMRVGAYVQDKIEFEGFIGTVGLRADWNNPNCDWFNMGSYDNYSNAYDFYYTRLGKEFLLTDATRHQAKGHLKISPRFGISHPISENVKLYFNYGDFYSLPTSYDLYQIFWGPIRSGVRYFGNPEVDWPLTRAYELGTDWNIADIFRFHLAGYYKDVTNQLAAVLYVGYDDAVYYKVPENLNFEDIRGIDFRISKEFGNWIRGWLNYDYSVRSYGVTGRAEHYQSQYLESTQGSWDTLEYAYRPQPILQANIQFVTPKDLGLLLGNISLSFNYTWEAGAWETYDPVHEDPADPERRYLNMQWKPYRNVQARLQKGISFAGTTIAFFAEVDNLFNWKYLDTGSGSFLDDKDRDAYLSSLKLPLYNEEGYGGSGEPGNDQFGDFKTDEKPYIDDPNLIHLAFHNPRYFVFGVKFDF